MTDEPVGSPADFARMVGKSPPAPEPEPEPQAAEPPEVESVDPEQQQREWMAAFIAHNPKAERHAKLIRRLHGIPEDDAA